MIEYAAPAADRQMDAGLTVNDIMQDSRLTHVRELKTEVARLKAELASANAACREWENHFALALAAARDADNLPSGGAILAIDGWNVVFNSRFKADGDAHEGKRRLIEAVQAYAHAHPAVFTWLVFDGSEENAEEAGSFRVSYTGGTGEHRADRLITDYVRMMRLAGRRASVTVVTNDKSFGRAACLLGAEVRTVKEFVDEI